MVWVALVGMPHPRGQRGMAEFFGLRNSVGLRPVIGRRDARPVRVFQDIMGDGGAFRAAFRLGFDVNVCHGISSCGVVGLDFPR